MCPPEEEENNGSTPPKKQQRQAPAKSKPAPKQKPYRQPKVQATGDL